MLIEIDTTKNDCRYEYCKHYDEGKCLDDNARKDCLEIAMAVLCVSEDENGRSE